MEFEFGNATGLPELNVAVVAWLACALSAGALGGDTPRWWGENRRDMHLHQPLSGESVHVMPRPPEETLAYPRGLCDP